MDHWQQSNDISPSGTDEPASMQTERSVFRVCFAIGVIGISILLVVATHAQGGAIGARPG